MQGSGRSDFELRADAVDPLLTAYTRQGLPRPAHWFRLQPVAPEGFFVLEATQNYRAFPLGICIRGE
jgi:hypothetical protein